MIENAKPENYRTHRLQDSFYRFWPKRKDLFVARVRRFCDIFPRVILYSHFFSFVVVWGLGFWVWVFGPVLRVIRFRVCGVGLNWFLDSSYKHTKITLRDNGENISDDWPGGVLESALCLPQSLTQILVLTSHTVILTVQIIKLRSQSSALNK